MAGQNFKHNKEESILQAKIVQYYNNNFCLEHHNPRGLIFSVPNELAGGNKLATIQAVATGLLSGVSDLILITPKGKLFFIELKDGNNNNQSDKQIEFENRVTKLGFEYKLIRTFNEFQQWIESK